MNAIDADFIRISFLDDDVVLVTARHGVEIDAEKARRGNQLISEQMPGDYGMIIDRKEDYSIKLVEVYEVLNSLPRLKAIAIVHHRRTTSASVGMEKVLFKRPLEVFDNIDDARGWIKGIVHR